ncbi:SRPBCC family protein [Micromonospora sp. LZ34]
MSPIVTTIEVARPPAEAFAYVTDPTRFAEWQQDVVSVRMADGRPPAVGSRFTTTRRIGRGEQAMTQEITEISAPRSWAARGVDGPIRPDATITVEPLSGGARSRITISLDFRGSGFGELIVPVVRRMAAKAGQASFRNLKERLDRGA